MWGVEQACQGQRGGGDKCRVIPSGSLIKLDLKMPAVVIIPYPRYWGRPSASGVQLWCQNDDGVSRPYLALCLDGNVSCSVSVQPGHEVYRVCRWNKQTRRAAWQPGSTRRSRIVLSLGHRQCQTWGLQTWRIHLQRRCNQMKVTRWMLFHWK